MPDLHSSPVRSTAPIPSSGMSSRCVAVLRAERVRLIRAFVAGGLGARGNRFDEPDDVFKQRVGESLDLLIGYLEQRPHFDALYVGLRLFELQRPERDRAANLEASRASVEHDWSVLRNGVMAQLNDAELGALETAFRKLTEPLRVPAQRHVRTLLIGDCLMSEICSFLVGTLLAEGISIDTFPINSRDAKQLRKTVDDLGAQAYDVILFSPFSHARLPELEALFAARSAWATPGRIDALIHAVQEQTESLLEFLADRFECPIFVHNASMTRRSGSAVASVVGGALTTRARSNARERLNTWLRDYAAKKNAATFQHVFVLDENAVAQRLGRGQAGRVLYESPFQHSTRLSQALAAEYQSIIGAVVNLLGKKLVVCDLDNTLWEGVIGEGAVEHLVDRQRILKRLKDEGGVVLSIVSKNDPSNVHFRGGVLSEADFVAPQISWGGKPKAIGELRTLLNLQTTHMVFIDDRPDERALVKEAHGDVVVLDATDAGTWHRIELWADMVAGSSDLDRTTLYREQLERERIAKGDSKGEVSEPDHEALEQLGLTITLRPAQRGDLKRVAELVNRTNQWNLRGSRTSYEQVRGWHESADTTLLLGAAADRFGDMGTVCVALMAMRGNVAEIPLFVLSCRVFGYGVETAMLAEITRRCSERLGHRIIGKYIATAQNHPCKTMYPDHGFEQVGDDFVWDGTRSLPGIPWAKIQVENR